VSKASGFPKRILDGASTILRATFFGAVFLPVLGMVSSGISSLPKATNFGDVNAIASLGVGIVVFTFLGAIMVAIGALWGLISVPILGLRWFRIRAVGARRTVSASAYGLVSGIVSAWSMGAHPKEEPLWLVAASVLGAAASPFIAWAAGWNSYGSTARLE
jgi:hypothetical protein